MVYPSTFHPYYAVGIIMFNKKDKRQKLILDHIEEIAGDRIRKFPEDVQEEALQEAVLAYLEGKDILEHLKLWRRNERRYQKKILAFTRARPLKRDKEEMKQISKDYR